MSDLPLYRAYYHRNRGLVIDGLSPARGTQKRPPQSTREPYTNKAGIHVSVQASWFHDAKQGNDDAYVRLVDHLGDQIYRHARHEGWKVATSIETATDLAEIALWPCFDESQISDKQCADRLGIAKASFRKNWKPKLLRIDMWIDKWKADADKLRR